MKNTTKVKIITGTVIVTSELIALPIDIIKHPITWPLIEIKGIKVIKEEAKKGYVQILNVLGGEIVEE